MKLSEKIINIRNDNNLTQEQLAEILFVTRQTVSNWENNKCYPDITTLLLISEKFNISFDDLIRDDKEMIKDIDKKIKDHKYKKIFLIIFILITFLISFYLGYKLFMLPSPSHRSRLSQHWLWIPCIVLQIPTDYLFYTW